MQLKDLKQDRRNYRKHNQRNLDLIKKSVEEVGLGRSVVIDNENEIICGNGLVSTLDKNTPVKIIETDGSELVVVKRTDLATDDAKRKQLAVMDNSTSDSSEFDFELMQEDFDIEKINEWGIEFEIKEEDFDIEEIKEYSETYNIIVKCADYEEAKKIDEKFSLNLDFDNQKIVVNAEKLLK